MNFDKIRRSSVLFSISLGWSTCVALGISINPAHALPKYLRAFKTEYPTAQKIVTCTLCHNTADMSRNAYGLDFKLKEFNFKATEPLDSDQDGFSNSEEILSDHAPGNPTDFPGTPTGPLQLDVEVDVENP
jgi:hypothetical protein